MRGGGGLEGAVRKWLPKRSLGVGRAAGGRAWPLPNGEGAVWYGQTQSGRNACQTNGMMMSVPSPLSSDCLESPPIIVSACAWLGATG